MNGKNLERTANLRAESGQFSLEISQIPSLLSDDSNLSLSDNASHGTNTPPPLQFIPMPLSYNANPDPSLKSQVTTVRNSVNIYKPKYHVIVKNNIAVKQFYPDRPNVNNLHKNIERIDDDETVVEAVDLRLHKLRHRQDTEPSIENQETFDEALDLRSHKLRHAQHSPVESVRQEPELSRKRCYNEDVIMEFKSEQTDDSNIVLPPQQSPGPFLGNTRLVEVKQPRLEQESPQTVPPISPQQFDREVRILDTSCESKAIPRHTDVNNEVSTALNLSSKATNLLSSHLTPSVSYLKQSANILTAEPIKPYVIDISEPKNLSMLLASVDTQRTEKNTNSIDNSKPLERLELNNPAPEINSSSNFSQPSSLPFGPETLTHRCPNGTISAAYSLALINPEIPRSEKPYGQLYLNGYVYTYLGLTCSTELFYCTYNRPQPTYIKHHTGFSMYSNWKVRKDALTSLEVGHCDTRHRPAGYTLARSRSEDILTYSSQRPNSPTNSDKKLESFGQDEDRCNESDDQLVQSQQLPVSQSKLQSTFDLHEKTLNLHITENTIKKQQESPTNHEMLITETELKLESSSNAPRSELSRKPESFQPSIHNANNYISLTEDTRSVCSICNKIFNKSSQLRLHMNIHYFERPFRCETCGKSFRTKGHLIKHERSTLHQNATTTTSNSGAATTSDPRPFKCTDCESAFRIHGHLAKHFRSKIHIMKLECLEKLPFGICAELEKAGVDLNDIDTTDCDTSLASLQVMAQKLCSKNSTEVKQWEP